MGGVPPAATLEGIEMAAPKGRITNGPDLLAYVLAHAAGFAFALTVNPMIFRSLIAQGYRAHVLLAAVELSIATSGSCCCCSCCCAS